MKSSIMMAVEDIAGEGVSAVLDRVTRYGVGAVTVAAAYHRARDVTPHGAQRVKTRYDGLHSVVDPNLFGALVPPQLPGHQAIDDLSAALGGRGLALNGWGVFCHNTTIGEAHPSATQENCFGDRAAPADLCPSQPSVAEYARGLAISIARLDVETVFAESLHFGSFDHGYHHERSFVPLSAMDRYVLGVCFCGYCCRLASERSVDAAQARLEACRAVEPALNGLPGPDVAVAPEVVADRVGDSFARYVLSRVATVTELAQSVGEAVENEGVGLTFLDMTGAAKGYADGEPGGSLAVSDSWQSGVDVAAISATGSVHAIGVLAYARSTARVAADVRAYRRAIGPGTDLRVLLRPSLPDCVDADALVDHLRAVRAADGDAVDYYHYGLCTLVDLDRIRVANGTRDPNGTA